MKTVYVHWNSGKVKLTWYPSKYPEAVEKVTSVHGYCFDGDKVLLAYIRGRGFEIPGGHMEEGESPEEALHREVYEEGRVRGKIAYLGMLEVSHEENPEFDPNGKYPLIGYQLFYRMDITATLPFERDNESLTRIWVETSEVKFVLDGHELLLDILDEAVRKKEH
jgi:8-oxo-dGTP pyrophosphatase MutT (NUDIX family)